MEIINISNSKIKISLTYEDLEKYSLSCNDINYDNTETRRAFWSILDDAKHTSGFDAAKSRVFIQVFSSPAGGCEMFVSRIFSEGEESVVCVRDPVAGIRCSVYSFEGLLSLIRACRLLCDLGYSHDSSAFYKDGTYYLVLSCPDMPEDNSICHDISYSDILCEFGTLIRDEMAPCYINEHCTCFCSSPATKKLASLSAGSAKYK